MRLTQRHIELLFAGSTRASLLDVTELALLYELLLRLEISTQSYFSRMLLSTAVASMLIFGQTLFNAEMYKIFPTGESHYIHVTFEVDVIVLLIYLGLFAFFSRKYHARAATMSELVRIAKARAGIPMVARSLDEV
jgi:hypothetical protein